MTGHSPWHDVFGTEIQEGDYILSAAKTGVLKVGTAYYSNRGNLMLRATKQYTYGSERSYSWTSSTSAAGVNVVVLKTKDGVIPGPVQNIW